MKYYKAFGLAKSYKEYMQSNLWKIKREEWLVGQDCELCNKKATQVHHKNYESLGNEKKRDISFLCAKCHHNIHKK